MERLAGSPEPRAPPRPGASTSSSLLVGETSWSQCSGSGSIGSAHPKFWLLTRNLQVPGQWVKLGARDQSFTKHPYLHLTNKVPPVYKAFKSGRKVNSNGGEGPKASVSCPQMCL